MSLALTLKSSFSEIANSPAWPKWGFEGSSCAGLGGSSCGNAGSDAMANEPARSEEATVRMKDMGRGLLEGSSTDGPKRPTSTASNAYAARGVQPNDMRWNLSRPPGLP